MKERCGWLKDGQENALMTKYHDEEWGTPLHDDHGLFEFLVLSGTQAGLSWSTVLNKRAAYQKAFNNFNPAKVARYTDSKIEKLLLNPGIIRNRLKVQSAVKNAKAFLKVQDEIGSFDAYLWDFVDGVPIINRRRSSSELPARTKLSDQISKDLKAKGFSFVGTTICCAFMQTVGLLNDHVPSCFRHKELSIWKSDVNG